MRAVFYIWGGFGFLFCGLLTFGVAANNPATATLLMVLLMWIGGMVLLGLAAILQYLEWRNK